MKLGIALSGGGIRGIAHAGVLQALEESNIKIDIIGGTSCGSMVAILYAMGYSPYHIYILFERFAKEIAKMNSMPILSGVGNIIKTKNTKITGFKDGETIEKIFNNLAKRRGINNIKQIQMPIVIPTVDVMNSNEYIFTNKTPEDNQFDKYITNATIGKVVRASSSFPVFFTPCSMEKHIFMDGGMLNNIPIEEVKKQGADKVIAVKFNSDDINETSNVMDLMMKTLDIMGAKIAENSLKESDYTLEVYTDKTGLFDIEKLKKCYDFGYECTMKNIEKIKELNG